MSTAIRSKLYTVEDLERLSAQGYHYELIRGELREMPPAGAEHGNTTQRLSQRVGIFIEDNDLGESFATETGFIVGRNPDSVLAPDYAFIIKERMPAQWPRGFMPVVPDIVLETRSPNDTKREVAEKIARWMEVGVRLAWEIDPPARRLTVHRPGAEPRVLGIDDVLTGEDVLPGFSLPVRKLFRETTRENTGEESAAKEQN